MTKTQADTRSDKIAKSDTEWRTQLTPEQFYVTRQHGTERAGTSPINKEKRTGNYACVCCGEPLFTFYSCLQERSGRQRDLGRAD